MEGTILSEMVSVWNGKGDVEQGCCVEMMEQGCCVEMMKFQKKFQDHGQEKWGDHQK